MSVLSKNDNLEKQNGRDEYLELQERTHLGAARLKTHFMGNIASALYHLCDVDTERAQESLLALFGYLRQSVECINQKSLLAFPWELRHAQSYLSLETLRFEDRLQVYYETEAEDFELPPLTLQPLVENAVKHGLAPITERPTTITITSRRLPEGGLQIQVIDDGAGFDPSILQDASYDEKSLACIRRRVERELGGSLRVESRPGQGTTVTVSIPKKD